MGGFTADGLYEELLSAMRNSTLIPFEFGRSGTIQVKMRPTTPAEMTALRQSEFYDLGNRTGLMPVRCEEIIR